MRILLNSNAALKQRWGCWLTWEQILKWQRCVCTKEDRGSVFFFPLTPVYRKTIGHFFLLIRLLDHVLLLPLLLITTVWAPSGLCFALLPARQSVNYRRPAGSRFERKTHSRCPQSFPVLYVLLLFLFFLRLSIYNSGQLRMWNASVNKSFNLPTSIEVRENPVKVYIFPLLKT